MSLDFKTQFKASLFSTNKDNFEKKAITLFQYQANNNAIYKLFLEHLKVSPEQIQRVEKIPFMPIEFFKKHKIVSSKFQETSIFQSSGTTGSETSKHYVEDTQFYLENCQQIFESFYGKIEEYTVLALLPDYLERQNSSLVLMADDFIKKSKEKLSGFYLYNFEELSQTLHNCMKEGKKVLLLGVTFALLDFAEAFPMPLKNTIIMETGGMKGRKKEMIRSEVHKLLKNAFEVESIHSEYGMTELLSQGYSKGNGIFETPPWLQLYLREVDNPLKINQSQRYGAINILDLANIDSCAFIATQDLGKISSQGFEIIGRLDNSDMRGCNLLVI
ncbi:MAG: acyl transferase [Cytophagales bacterium]|nr:acyl transferase [Cytophagales bacterium]